jgi:repressor LexA
VLAQEHIEDHCGLPPSFFKPAADYFLRVRGDSMINVGIFDGDLLAVHSTPVANNGDIVVARIDDEVTICYRRAQRRRITARHLGFSGIEANGRRQSLRQFTLRRL